MKNTQKVLLGLFSVAALLGQGCASHSGSHSGSGSSLKGQSVVPRESVPALFKTAAPVARLSADPNSPFVGVWERIGPDGVKNPFVVLPSGWVLRLTDCFQWRDSGVPNVFVFSGALGNYPEFYALARMDGDKLLVLGYPDRLSREDVIGILELLKRGYSLEDVAPDGIGYLPEVFAVRKKAAPPPLR